MKAADIDIANIDTGSVEFQNALKLISYTSQSVFLTGKAGTGKSTFLKYLTATTKKKFVVLAPTGIAAVNAGGQTIHSFFRMPFKPIVPTDTDFYSSASRLKKRLHYPKETVKLIQSLNLIIIDEVSMVRADTIDFIDRVLRVYCNPRLPFGGKQLLLVGDVFQLEPVITGDMRDVLDMFYPQGNFFFNARAFSEISIVPIELTKVYRQNDNQFIALLDRIRIGTFYATDLQLLNSRVQTANTLALDDDFTITIATRRDIVNNINETRLQMINRPERKYKGAINGDFPENSLPTDHELVLKEGAQVVFVRNDMERRWVNGSIGRVVQMNKDNILIEMPDGKKHAVEVEVWENVKYEYDEVHRDVKETVIGTFSQFPLKLAWALTIHKSQGLTFDKVVIDVGSGAFSGGQTYVALSRCRSLEGIQLRQPVRDRDIFVNPKVIKFSQSFNDERLINSALEFARADDCYARAAKCFDCGEYSEAVRLFAEAVSARNMLMHDDVVRLLSIKMLRMSQLEQEVKSLRKQVADDQKRFRSLAIEYVTMGEEVRQEGWELDSAIANYDKAISLSPDYYLAWLGKGLALAQSGDMDGALDCLNKTAKLDTEDYRAPYEAGRLLINNGDIAQGTDLLLLALERNENAADVCDALADVFDSVNDKGAAAYYRKMAANIRKPRKNRKRSKSEE